MLATVTGSVARTKPLVTEAVSKALTRQQLVCNCTRARDDVSLQLVFPLWTVKDIRKC